LKKYIKDFRAGFKMIEKFKKFIRLLRRRQKNELHNILKVTFAEFDDVKELPLCDDHDPRSICIYRLKDEDGELRCACRKKPWWCSVFKDVEYRF